MDRRSFIENITLLTGGSTYLKIPDFFHKKGRGSQSVNPNDDENLLLSIQVTVPSSVGIGEEFWVGVRMLTKPFFTNWVPVWQRNGVSMDGAFNISSRGTHFMDNVIPQWEQEMRIEGDEGFEGISSFSFMEGATRPVKRLEGFRFTSAGVKFIRITDPKTGMVGVSNPIYVDEGIPNERLFWGDLHCHSIFGDGIRLPEEIYAFARDESFLDVFALTEHTEAITDSQWEYYKIVADDFNQPGRFVTFLGGEWTSPQYGHRNFLYPGADGPIFRCTNSQTDTPAKLYAAAKHSGALIMANHPTGSPSVWEQGPDTEVVRLVEIYGIGGIHEMAFGKNDKYFMRRMPGKGEVAGTFVVDGLAQGFRLGFIGTGDDHDGRPGDSLHELQVRPTDYKLLRGPGLMGVWAESLSREAIFDALWNRRVFGTTNNRTWLKFSINEVPMGSTINTSEKLNIRVEAACNYPIKQIHLIRGNEVIRSEKIDKAHVIWSVDEKSPDAATWYYVRIELADDHLAWSTPVWVNQPESSTVRVALAPINRYVS